MDNLEKAVEYLGAVEVASWDTWVRNPHYAGPPVPHPDDEEAHFYTEQDRLRDIEETQQIHEAEYVSLDDSLPPETTFDAA
jgi:hypothetical protein